MRLPIVHTPIWTLASAPLNVAYIAAVAAREGFDPVIHDINAALFGAVADNVRAFWRPDYLHSWHVEEPFLRDLAPLVFDPFVDGLCDGLLADDPFAIGISVNSPQFSIALARALKARRPDVPILVGGQCCEPDWFGRPLAQCGAIDAVFVGEAEPTFAAMLNELRSNGRDVTKLAPRPGVILGAHMTAGEAIYPGAAVLVPAMDEIPFPIYPGIDFRHYARDGGAAPIDPQTGAPQRSYSVLFSRGCVRSCDFCLQQTIWGGTFRLRSPANMADEIELRIREGATFIYFNDLLVNGNPRDLRLLCEELDRRGVSIPMDGSFIITRKLNDDATVQLMKKVGFAYLNFGIEHISGPVLHTMGKYYEESLVRENLETLRRNGVAWGSSWIVGYPAEQTPDFVAVVRFLLDAFPLFHDPPSFSICAVLPGSDLWKKRHELGIVMNDHDAMGWRSGDGRNTLAVRRLRAEMIQSLLAHLFGTTPPVTNMKGDARLGERLLAVPTDSLGAILRHYRQRLASMLVEVAAHRFSQALGGEGAPADQLVMVDDLAGFCAELDRRVGTVTQPVAA